MIKSNLVWTSLSAGTARVLPCIPQNLWENYLLDKLVVIKRFQNISPLLPPLTECLWLNAIAWQLLANKLEDLCSSETSYYKLRDIIKCFYYQRIWIRLSWTSWISNSEELDNTGPEINRCHMRSSVLNLWEQHLLLAQTWIGKDDEH